MLLFKPKQSSDELLPPPPPFPVLELEEQETKPEFFDKIINQAKDKPETAEEKEFNEILKEMDAKKPISPGKKEKSPVKKTKATKAKAKKSKAAKFSELGDLGLDIPDFELSKTLEEPDLGSTNQLLVQETSAKPAEISEAEEEIKDAIEGIKAKEKPSFFKRLFGIKKEQAPPKEEQMQKVPEVGDNSTIQGCIDKTREALMRFDLEDAKTNYLKLISIYNRIKPEEQAKVYHDIRELYFERKSAERLKV